MRFVRIFFCVAVASLLAGCATSVPFNNKLIGTKKSGVVVFVNNDKSIQGISDAVKKGEKLPLPEKNDYVVAINHYGSWDGWVYIGGIYPSGTLEVGDLIEVEYPKTEKDYGKVNLITKWNDDKPGGCYWKGGFRYQSGDVVCDDNPEGPKLRRENAEWLRDKFGNQKDG
ncbi:hypothetical protein [Chromobacterium amazonense]|uniref:hypothetical protein n=1 Tax=Chromobacterium amazonense TaxID=1382803 RepID=UPI0011B27AA8|nr:hypothetical protein [Chromobacterium amazonense]